MRVTGLIASTALSLALTSGAAWAQSQSSSTSKSAQPMPAQIEKKLKDQGFTNIQVVPGSYLVSAEDKQGDPVTMVIGPHSMTMFTTVSADDTTGAGSGQDRTKKN
jgi:hypothetical protein